MMLDFLKLSLNNLRRRKLRSWLTMIGIFIGIAAVVSLISLGQGLQDYISEQFEILGADKITIIGKAGFLVSPLASELSSKPLTKKDVELVEKIKGVEVASGLLIKSLEVEFKNNKKNVLVSGIEPDKYKKIFEGSYNIEEGRDLKKKDKGKLVIGYNTANKDFGKKIRVGEKLVIQGRKFEVIGILEKIGSSSDDSSIIMTLDSLRELIKEKEIMSMIFVKVKKGENVSRVAERIEKQMKKDRHEKLSEEPQTFSVQTSEQILKTFQKIFSVVQAVLIGIASISLLVGGVGIMNTMYTSVLERTKEIGTMKAIGAKNNQILFLFLLESGLLGLVGGMIGVGLGIGLAKGAEFAAAKIWGSNLLRASLNPLIIVGALIFSFVIGSLSGMLPAKQAASLKPVDALRWE